MANGYCTPLLAHMEALSGNNPAKKLSPLGFTKAVLSSMDDSVSAELNQQYEAGHQRGISVAYRERPLESVVSTTPSGCESAVTPAKKEFILPDMLYREVSFYMSDSLIRQYCKDSSECVKLNASGASEMNGDTSAMREVYDMLVEYGGVLMQSVNKALVTQAAIGFGKNIVSGLTTARNLEFTLGSNGMQDAFISLMADLRENEITNEVVMVGNGPFANLDLIRKWFANAAADNGINKANMMASFPGVFYDKDTKTIWGEDQIGVFEKGSLALISHNKYVNSFARRLGSSEFFSMALPVQEYGVPQQYLDKLMFDVQIREIDCPQNMNINGTANTKVEQGVQVILSKRFSLWQRPATLYAAGDPLVGTNGALRYTISEP